MIRGGDWPSTVAGECVTTAGSRCYPGERVADLRARVEQTVARPRASGRELARSAVEVRYDGFQCEGYELARRAADRRGRPTPRSASRAHGRRSYASTATTDARTFHLYGDTPGGSASGHAPRRIHSIDERVHLPSMLSTAQAVALFVRDWCGVNPRAVSPGSANGLGRRGLRRALRVGLEPLHRPRDRPSCGPAEHRAQHRRERPQELAVGEHAPVEAHVRAAGDLGQRPESAAAQVALDGRPRRCAATRAA
jgi:hypothetical protein